LNITKWTIEFDSTKRAEGVNRTPSPWRLTQQSSSVYLSGFPCVSFTLSISVVLCVWMLRSTMTGLL